VPDLAFDFDLSTLGLSSNGSHRSSLLSPSTRKSSQSSHATEQNPSPLGLIFPSGSDSGINNDVADFGYSGDTSSARKTATHAERFSIEGIESGLQDSGFDFDENGELVETVTGPAVWIPNILAQDDVLGGTAGNASAIASHVRKEHEEALRIGRVDVRR